MKVYEVLDAYLIYGSNPRVKVAIYDNHGLVACNRYTREQMEATAKQVEVSKNLVKVYI